MPLTDFQRRVCRLLAQGRLSSGESYVAGAAALNEALGTSRVSRDIDLFHDTDAALAASWTEDRATLLARGLEVQVIRSHATFVEAEVRDATGTVRIEWARDSAYRFFPLVEHEDFGLTLHPFDLATNKVLALVGRLEVRDWVDVIAADGRLQPLGLLAWAASAKDPGFGPGAILEGAARSGRYSAEEVETLAFDGPPPDAAALSRSWHAILRAATETIDVLPPAEVGTCVLDAAGSLFRGEPSDVRVALADGQLRFHRGRIGGAVPRVVTS
jgi:hypothetical protein